MQHNLFAAEIPFKSGNVIKEIFTLQHKLGSGSYGVIFSAIYSSGPNQKHVAIKLEKILPQYTLQANEVLVMKTMKNSRHFAKFYHCGTHEGYKFVVMELLGPSLLQLANRQFPFIFSLPQLLKFGIQAIESLCDLHHAGFVHRDIKLDNFMIGNSQKTAGRIYLIDFGLCKRINQSQNIEKASKHSNFRGTLRYASPNAHRHLELGRQDDLISLLYVLVELYVGKLPWNNITDSDIVLSLKIENQDGKLVELMPPEFKQFDDHIFTLNYEDEPDYLYLISILESIADREGIDLDTRFDWEIEIAQQRSAVIKKQQNYLEKRRFSANKRQKICITLQQI
ncbi:MAG: putative Tau-tubulin kinase 1 [Streblomastix strix]|uniref:non-specific serine/threonine protein kinase n=1 Tax=Streblomastix strix TaxID=222440 RepID=A0A5J4VJJ4_9EUKA|nr:MAG: putative Tau-tubulin kinase 1 [Streblomastix strix]